MIRFSTVLSLALLLLCCTLAWGGPPKKSSLSRSSKSVARSVDTRDADGNTPLMCATKKGDCEAMIKLIAAGADINARNPRESTPLMFATEGGLPAVDLLLQHGARVDPLRKDGMSALSFAVTQKRFDVFERLLAAGSDYRILDDRRQTLLHLAAIKGDARIAGRLLELGLSPDDLDTYNESPLINAARNGNTGVVTVLLGRKAQLSHWNSHKETALTLACAKGYLEIVKALLAAGAPIGGEEGDRAIAEAVEAKQVAVVRYLLDRGANINARGFFSRPLVSLAAWTHQPELAIELLKRGADANLKSGGDQSPLEMATFWTDSVELVKALVQSGARKEPNALIMCCGKNSPDMLAVLLDAGFDIAATGQADKMPYANSNCLHIAALRGSVEVISFVVEKTKSKKTASGEPLDQTLLNAQEAYYWTPLMEAVRRSDMSGPVVKALLDAGSKLEMVDHSGKTALHEAAEHNNAEAIRLLLARGAKADTSSKGGSTPLETAASYGKLDAVIALDQSPTEKVTRRWLPRLIENLADYDKQSDALEKALTHYGRLVEQNVLDKALWTAVNRNNLATTTTLLNHEANPNNSGEWVPVTACRSVEMAELLLKNRGKVDQVNNAGATMLIEAIKMERPALVRWALTHGANPNHLDRRGWNGLDYARESGVRELITMVAKAGGVSDRRSPVLWASEIYQRGEEKNNYLKAPPLVLKDMLIIGQENGYVYALNRSNGQIRWKRYLGGEINYEIRQADHDLYVTSDNHTLTRIRPKDGSVVWQYGYSGTQVASGAWFWRDLALLADYNGALYAVERATGKLRWKRDVGQLTHVSDGVDSISIAGDALFCMGETAGLIRHDLLTGVTNRFAAKDFGTPEIAEGSVFLPTKDGKLNVLDAKTMKLIQTVALPGKATVRPLFFKGRLYVQSEDHLSAFPLRSAVMRSKGREPLGALAWQIKTDHDLIARPIINNGRIVTFCNFVPKEEVTNAHVFRRKYAVTHLTTVEPKTGKLISAQIYKEYGGKEITPVAGGDVVYVLPLGEHGRMLALRVGE